MRALIDDMFETMYDAPGIGLAADADRRAQAHAGDRPAGAEDEEGEPVRNPRVFINPELFDPSAELRIYNEGCLSVPDQYAEVERPATIHARWLDRDGARARGALDGLLATCLQHEMDHLEGILFIDHLSRLKREMVLKKLEKARRGRRAA